MAGLLSLLWPFFQRFNLAEAPEGNFPERPMFPKQCPGDNLKDRLLELSVVWHPRGSLVRFTSSSSEVTSGIPSVTMTK